MYTEIIRIIEGALKNDTGKVISYVNLLIENLRKDGDTKTADRIENTLSKKMGNFVFGDQLINAPVDQESRLTMADVILPAEITSDVILSDSIQNAVDTFTSTVQHRNKLLQAGIETNTSLLLYGPPGCGKTTIAKYIAGTLHLPLVTARFDSLISSLLGNTAKNIRKIFDFASSRPCILFLDEFDAIGKARDDQHELGELKRVINSLLQNIDEFIASGNILIAATNHHELLDKAIWRRFNHIVDVSKPDRKAILQLMTSSLQQFKNNILDDLKKSEVVTESTLGLSFSDIKTVFKNTVSKNIIHNKEEVVLEDILTQLFLFKNNNKHDNNMLAKFLEEHGCSKLAISQYLGISYRQAGNILDKNK